MTSRVQKGAPIFRPIARGRGGARPGTSRQSTVSSEPTRVRLPTPDPVSEPVALVSEIDTPGIQTRETYITDSQMDSVQTVRAPPKLQTSNTAALVAVPTAGVNRFSSRALPPTVASTQHLQEPSADAHLGDSDFSAKHISTENTTLESDLPPDQQSSGDFSQNINTRTTRARDGKAFRSKKGTPEASENEIEGENSRPHKKRKPRGESIPPFDQNADPGEDIDPTVVTMAEICHDTGRGRVSSKAALIINNHATWKASNKEKRDRMRMAMELRKRGKDDEADSLLTGFTAETVKSPDEAQAEVVGEAVDVYENNTIPDESDEGFDYSQTVVAQNHNPQVRVGPNGEVILDEESTYIDRGPGDDDTVGYTHVVESDYTKFVNSGTFGRKLRGHRWSAEETEAFYDALGQFGENYELISMLLPGRDRRACKNKFKAEDKRNPERINYTLKNAIPVDIHTLSQRSGRDFSGPTPQISVPAPLLSVDETHAGSSTSATREVLNHQPKSRRKNRSRATAQEEGLQVVGGIDDAVFNDAD